MSRETTARVTRSLPMAEVRVTPSRTEISPAPREHARYLLSEKGLRIREVTSVVQTRFGFPENSRVKHFAETVENRPGCTMALAESQGYRCFRAVVTRRQDAGVEQARSAGRRTHGSQKDPHGRQSHLARWTFDS